MLLSHHIVVWLGYLVYCMFVYLLVCTVTDFSAAEKDSGVKLRTRVRLLSIRILSYFGELWLVWSRDTDITSGISYVQIAPGKKFAARLGGQSEFGGTVWWDFRLADGIVCLFVIPTFGIYSLLCVCLFVRLRISQRRNKIVARNFTCLFDYYPG